MESHAEGDIHRPHPQDNRDHAQSSASGTGIVGMAQDPPPTDDTDDFLDPTALDDSDTDNLFSFATNMDLTKQKKRGRPSKMQQELSTLIATSSTTSTMPLHTSTEPSVGPATSTSFPVHGLETELPQTLQNVQYTCLRDAMSTNRTG